MRGVMQVVVPLRGGAARPAVAPARQVTLHRMPLLQHAVHVAFAARAGADRARDRLDDVGPAGIANRLHGVEAQPVEVDLLEPVQRVVDEAVAHGVRLRTVEVDGRAPRRAAPPAEERRRVAGQVTAVRAEVVVDDVEKHRDAARVCGLHEALEVIGRAVARVGRKRQHAVAAPVAAAGEVGTGISSTTVMPVAARWSSLSIATANVRYRVKAPTCSSSITACAHGTPCQSASCQWNEAGSTTRLAPCTSSGLRREAGSGTGGPSSTRKA
jgi:hypothetical protein